ncbi:asparagine synthase [Necator americanus]|uniref:Asparagine synthase n=1 Tax=Necator americanus TaxID=51031 RepID=W2SZY5_NECAM|nr:asparagine synthase [Necator americanus]ETN74262.1 asparagine synthase [Necator americanus]
MGLKPDMNRVFVGRDIFGRLSLVFTVDGDEIVISDVVQDSSLSAWHEIPFAQVSCIDTTNKSAVMHSYLPSYPEGIVGPWADVFDSFSLKHEPMKDELIVAAAPACSVLDESLACVLWFALRGIGKDYDSGESVESHARTFFVGSGADELLAGYARHRTRFERDGAESIPEECEAELRRLGCRNGGRDARVAAALGKELRLVFLIANLGPIPTGCYAYHHQQIDPYYRHLILEHLS